MPCFLMFDIYGPMAAWGEVAVGETRSSAAYPTRSAILGLLAAALGLRRDNEPDLTCLANSVWIGVRVDDAGEPLTDYHTAEPPRKLTRGEVPHSTRRSQLTRGERRNVVLSRRTYRVDARYTIILQGREDTEYPLGRLRDALERPRYVPYLGRKSCPVSIPMRPRLVEVISASAALAGSPVCDQIAGIPWYSRSTGTSGVDFYFDPQMTVGVATGRTLTRRDVPLNRARWQFANRTEASARIPRGTETME